MTDAYKKVLSIPLSLASKMASLTMGYSFAFQMLGYLYWDNNCEKEIEEILSEYDYALREYSYDKIWSELSDTDKKIICELAKQGLIDTSEYGNISILLPRFHEYVNYKLM